MNKKHIDTKLKKLKTLLVSEEPLDTFGGVCLDTIKGQRIYLCILGNCILK